MSGHSEGEDAVKFPPENAIVLDKWLYDVCGEEGLQFPAHRREQFNVFMQRLRVVAKQKQFVANTFSYPSRSGAREVLVLQQLLESLGAREKRCLRQIARVDENIAQVKRVLAEKTLGVSEMAVSAWGASGTSSRGQAASPSPSGTVGSGQRATSAAQALGYTSLSENGAARGSSSTAAATAAATGGGGAGFSASDREARRAQYEAKKKIAERYVVELRKKVVDMQAKRGVLQERQQLLLAEKVQLEKEFDALAQTEEIVVGRHEDAERQRQQEEQLLQEEYAAWSVLSSGEAQASPLAVASPLSPGSYASQHLPLSPQPAHRPRPLAPYAKKKSADQPEDAHPPAVPPAAAAPFEPPAFDHSGSQSENAVEAPPHAAYYAMDDSQAPAVPQPIEEGASRNVAEVVVTTNATATAEAAAEELPAQSQQSQTHEEQSTAAEEEEVTQPVHASAPSTPHETSDFGKETANAAVDTPPESATDRPAHNEEVIITEDGVTMPLSEEPQTAPSGALDEDRAVSAGNDGEEFVQVEQHPEGEELGNQTRVSADASLSSSSPASSPPSPSSAPEIAEEGQVQADTDAPAPPPPVAEVEAEEAANFDTSFPVVEAGVPPAASSTDAFLPLEPPPHDAVVEDVHTDAGDAGAAPNKDRDAEDDTSLQPGGEETEQDNGDAHEEEKQMDEVPQTSLPPPSPEEVPQSLQYVHDPEPAPEPEPHELHLSSPSHEGDDEANVSNPTGNAVDEHGTSQPLIAVVSTTTTTTATTTTAAAALPPLTTASFSDTVALSEALVNASMVEPPANAYERERRGVLERLRAALSEAGAACNEARRQQRNEEQIHAGRFRQARQKLKDWQDLVTALRATEEQLKGQVRVVSTVIEDTAQRIAADSGETYMDQLRKMNALLMERSSEKLNEYFGEGAPVEQADANIAATFTTEARPVSRPGPAPSTQASSSLMGNTTSDPYSTPVRSSLSTVGATGTTTRASSVASTPSAYGGTPSATAGGARRPSAYGAPRHRSRYELVRHLQRWEAVLLEERRTLVSTAGLIPSDDVTSENAVAPEAGDSIEARMAHLRQRFLQLQKLLLVQPPQQAKS